MSDEGERALSRWAARGAIASLAADELADLFEPLLADDALASDQGRVRAEAILTELEAALAARYERSVEVEANPNDYSDEDNERFPTRPPAPLLQARCDHLASRRDAIGTLARACGDGYRAHIGWFVASQFTEIHLGEGDDPPFPCTIAGFLVPYDVSRTRVRDAVLGLDDPPFGLGYFQHATAGIALHYLHIVGYVLVLGPEERRSVDELAAFVGHTSGERVASGDVATWSTRLGAIVPAGLESIIEGLAVGAPGSPRASLDGRIALVGRPRIPWRDFVLDVDASTFEPDGVYDGPRERALVTLGAALGLGAPRVVLLWGNSD